MLKKVNYITEKRLQMIQYFNILQEKKANRYKINAFEII